MKRQPDGCLSKDANWHRIWFKENDPENFCIMIDKIVAVQQIIESGPSRAAFDIMLLDGNTHTMRYTELKTAEADRRDLLLMLEDCCET